MGHILNAPATYEQVTKMSNNYTKVDPQLMNAACNAVLDSLKKENLGVPNLTFSAIEFIARGVIEAVLRNETCAQCGCPLAPPALCTVCSNLMNTSFDRNF